MVWPKLKLDQPIHQASIVAITQWTSMKRCDTHTNTYKSKSKFQKSLLNQTGQEFVNYGTEKGKSNKN